MLVVSSLAVLAAVLLHVRADGQVALRGLSEYALPPTCLSYAWFGVKCPGCGLTRSIVYLAHGDWKASWRLHRLGWLMASAIVLQFPYRILALLLPDRSVVGLSFCRLFGQFLIAALLANWLLDMIVAR
jgi:hypothetical protein